MNVKKKVPNCRDRQQKKTDCAHLCTHFLPHTKSYNHTQTHTDTHAALYSLLIYAWLKSFPLAELGLWE